MKNLILSLLLLGGLLPSICRAGHPAPDPVTTVVIGQVQNSTASFVTDPSVLKSDWQAFLSNNPQIGACTLSAITIVASGPEYYLVAYGTQSTIPLRSILHLEKTPGGCLMAGTYTVTCTTTDCSSESNGCAPQASSCSACSNNGKCTKTITSGIEIFPSVTPGSCPL